jgi:hypothetical protein
VTTPETICPEPEVRSDRLTKDAGEFPVSPGLVIRQLVCHDDWCPALNGGTPADCNCNRQVAFHLRPRKSEPCWPMIIRYGA